MKKNILFLMLASAAMLLTTSCVHEEDDIFDASAAERLNAASDKYSQMLEAAEGGWVIEYYPTNEDALTTGQGYLWMVKFGKDESCNVGMNNYFSGNTYRECKSLWQVITDNGPVLTFNSYNPNVHAFSDPDVRTIPESSDNVWGTGVGGDYEFVIVDAPEDHSYVMLKGKKRGTYNRMTPLPAGTDFEGYLAEVDSFQNVTFSETAINENVLTVGGAKYAIYAASSGFLAAYPYDGDEITETSVHPFLVTKRDGKFYFRFRSAFEANETGEQEFVYDADNDRFVGTENAENTIEGEDPSHFVQLWLEAGAKWALVNGAKAYDMSDSFGQSYQDAAAGLLGTGWTVQSVMFKTDADRLVLDIAARNSRRQTVTLSYAFSSQVADDYSWTINYEEPVVTERNQTAQTILNNVPDLQKFLQTLSGTYRAKSTATKFELSTMTLTKTDDANMWFNIHSAY